jgi:hypothetical protein
MKLVIASASVLLLLQTVALAGIDSDIPRTNFGSRESIAIRYKTRVQEISSVGELSRTDHQTSHETGRPRQDRIGPASDFCECQRQRTGPTSRAQTEAQDECSP